MFSMTCFVCTIMWIRVHFYDVVILITHCIAHVIIQPLKICTTQLTLLNTFNSRILHEGYALFKCFSLLFKFLLCRELLI